MYPHFPLFTRRRNISTSTRPTASICPIRATNCWRSQHPAIQQLRYFFRNDQTFPEELTRTALASYYALVTLTDEHIGRLLSIVDGSPLQENTVVIYLSDHGEMAGQHGIWQKQCFYESSVRVPLVVRGPHMAQGARVPGNVSLVDIMPTLLDLAETQIPEGLRGRSLLPSLRGRLPPG